MSQRPSAPVRVAVVGVSVVYTIVLYASGLTLDSRLRQGLALLPAAVGLVLVAWDLWLWRLPGVHKLVSRPRLDGLWSADLHPTRESRIPEGGNRGPIAAYLMIRQSYWSISIRQYTAESKSDSRASFWQRNVGAEVETLSFLYDNNPEQRHLSRSPRHLGTCTLDPVSRKPVEMTGVYFTDRYTKGDMALRLVDRSAGHPTFAAAAAHRPTKKWWRRKTKTPAGAS